MKVKANKTFVDVRYGPVIGSDDPVAIEGGAVVTLPEGFNWLGYEWSWTGLAEIIKTEEEGNGKV